MISEVPKTVTNKPRTILPVTISSKINQPQNIPKKGIRKVTEVATVAPDRWMSLKNRTKAKAVQKSARVMTLSQLLADGIVSGNRTKAKGIITNPAPKRLPAEPTRGRTF